MTGASKKHRSRIYSSDSDDEIKPVRADALPMAEKVERGHRKIDRLDFRAVTPPMLEKNERGYNGHKRPICVPPMVATGRRHPKREEVRMDREKLLAYDYRPMMCPIIPSDLDKYDFSFFLRPLVEILYATRPMSHSLRFWLAVKFCRLRAKYEENKNVPVGRDEKMFYDQYCLTKICTSLGLDYYCVRSCIKGALSKTSCRDFDGLSPLENSPMSNNVLYFVRNALNIRSIIESGCLSAAVVRASMEKQGLDYEYELKTRDRLARERE